MKKKKRQFLDLAGKYRDGALPSCPHFGECGGCLFQDISYGNQLLLKKEYLEGLLGGMCDVGDIAPSEPFRYRNRMDFVTAFGRTGLRRRGSYRHVVDIASCAIMQERSDLLFQKARPLLHTVEDYDYLRHSGYLRYIVLRQGRYTGELMCNLVISRRENLLDGIIRELYSHADSISVILSESMADLSYGEVLETVKGGSIAERFDGIAYRITPNSFFQSNSEIALVMYRRIRTEATGHVLDLYSGVGSISLFIAPGVESVTGVELLGEGVASAQENARANSITNAEFVNADALEYLRGVPGRFDTVVLDPPRSGMHPRAVRLLREMGPPHIVYMSCNPDTFRTDVIGLEDYSIESFEAFDMFPQTPHIETLAVLKRKNPIV